MFFYKKNRKKKYRIYKFAIFESKMSSIKNLIMNNNPTILQMRGTIFTQPIGYSIENCNKLKPIIDKYSLALCPVQLILNGVPKLTENSPWQLLSGNNLFRIVFINDKIDIIQGFKQEEEYDESSFIQECKFIFKTILSTMEYKVKRVAFAPNFAFDNNSSFSSDLFFSNILTKNSFKGSSAKNVDLTNTFRVKEKLGSNDIDINYVIKIFQGGKIQNGVIKECLLANLDINSVPLLPLNTSFPDNEIIDYFFDGALEMKKNILNMYFDFLKV